MVERIHGQCLLGYARYVDSKSISLDNIHKRLLAVVQRRNILQSMSLFESEGIINRSYPFCFFLAVPLPTTHCIPRVGYPSFQMFLLPQRPLTSQQDTHRHWLHQVLSKACSSCQLKIFHSYPHLNHHSSGPRMPMSSLGLCFVSSCTHIASRILHSHMYLN